MVSPRRAALPDDGAPAAELGRVSPARRAVTPRAVGGRLLRLALAPLAIAAVVGVAVSVVAPPSLDVADRTDSAIAVTMPLGVSRAQARPALEASPEPSPDPSPEPSVSVAASPTPSAAPSAASAPVSEKPSAPASTASSAPKATATPAPDYTTVGTKAGTRYATAAVNVRSGPSTSFKAITTLVEDDSVTITDRRADGWRQVVIGKTSGWIKESLLTETKPAEPVAQAAGASTSKETAVPDASAACPNAGSLEQNLTARTVTVLRAVCAQFPAVKSYGGYRAGDSGNHGAGKAIDVMISGEAGWEIAKWARANASALGISEVIYEQKIWTTQRSGEGWRAMSDRGSATANHYDHVHLSVR